jgi:hypothetical protein
MTAQHVCLYKGMYYGAVLMLVVAIVAIIVTRGFP